MHHVNQNSPAPKILKAAAAALFLFLAVFHITPLQLNAQAFSQLNAYAEGLEVPLAPAPSEVTRYTAAPGFNIYFLNVGQGDATYIELPNGQNALIDGGPSAAAGPLAQFLAEKNVTRIDHVVLTHPHSDHYNGLPYVFSHVKVGNFYDTRLDNTSATGDDTLREQVRSLGVNTVYPAPGDNLPWGGPGVAAKVFNSCPEAAKSSGGINPNDCSIVIRLSYQGASALFEGDASSAIEDRMIAAFGAELRSEVLKVGHHGSKYSTSQAFLNAVKPAKAYIEVGKNNYGHPTPATLNRLVAAGIKVYRTDLDGTQAYSPFAALLASAGSVVSAN